MTKQQFLVGSQKLVGATMVGALIFMLATFSVGIKPAQAVQAPQQSIFLTIDGVTGDSQIHPGEFDIDSFSWESTATNVAKGGLNGNKVSYGDVRVTFKTSNASTNLLDLLASGKHVNSARLEFEDSLKNMVYYLNLSDASVVGYSVSGAGTDQNLTDHVTLSFKKMSFGYLSANGARVGSVTVSK